LITPSGKRETQISVTLMYVYSLQGEFRMKRAIIKTWRPDIAKI